MCVLLIVLSSFSSSPTRCFPPVEGRPLTRDLRKPGMMKVAVKSSPNLDRFTEEEEFIFPSVINQHKRVPDVWCKRSQIRSKTNCIDGYHHDILKSRDVLLCVARNSEVLARLNAQTSSLKILKLLRTESCLKFIISCQEAKETEAKGKREGRQTVWV